MYRNLLAEMEKSGLNEQKVASELNISKSNLAEKIKGEKDFRLEECLKIKSILGEGRYSLVYLFEE